MELLTIEPSSFNIVEDYISKLPMVSFNVGFTPSNQPFLTEETYGRAFA